MRTFLQELYRRNPLLAGFGWLMLIGFLYALFASFVDQRTVTGVNTWIKPMKFCLSVAAYVWTIAWFLHYVRESRRAFNAISLGVAVVMFIEMVLLYSQAARGVSSHFNFTTPYNAVVFSMMGMMIYANLVLDAWAAGLFFVKRTALPNSYLWGIRLGFALFLLFAFQGQLMINRMAHSVGVADGGPGLPMVNWSTVGGDLRIAHALGLHALQIIPLFGWLLCKHRERTKFLGANATLVTVLFAFVYAAVCFGLLAQALAGRPMLAGSEILNCSHGPLWADIVPESSREINSETRSHKAMRLFPVFSRLGQQAPESFYVCVILGPQLEGFAKIKAVLVVRHGNLLFVSLHLMHRSTPARRSERFHSATA